MDIEQVLTAAQGKTEQEQLSMLLSNRIDHTSAEGGLISVKQFNVLVKDILHWRNAGLAQAPAVPATASEEGNWC